MYCRLCGKFFYIRRGFVELFSQKKEYLCDNCHNMLNLKLEIIELERYHCYILSMFKKGRNIDYNYYINEYNIIVSKYICRDKYQFLFFDYIYLTDFNLEVLNMISKLFKKNLFILTFFIKN